MSDLKRRKGKTMTMQEVISKINGVAIENFEVAEGMLEVVNDIMGTKFGWLNRRVVIFDNPNASTAEKYAHCHDAMTVCHDAMAVTNQHEHNTF